MFELGSQPTPLRVIFTRGSDFHDQVSAANDFDAVAPLLVFPDPRLGDLAFEAVLLSPAGIVADFVITAADIETLLARQGRAVYLEHLGAVIAKGRFEVA